MARRVVVHVHNNSVAKDRKAADVGDPGKSEEMGDPVSEQASSGEIEPDIGASEAVGPGAIGDEEWPFASRIQRDGLKSWWELAKKHSPYDGKGKDAAPRKCKCGTHPK